MPHDSTHCIVELEDLANLPMSEAVPRCFKGKALFVWVKSKPEREHRGSEAHLYGVGSWQGKIKKETHYVPF